MLVHTHVAQGSGDGHTHSKVGHAVVVGGGVATVVVVVGQTTGDGHVGVGGQTTAGSQVGVGGHSTGDGHVGVGGHTTGDVVVVDGHTSHTVGSPQMASRCSAKKVKQFFYR